MPGRGEGRVVLPTTPLPHPSLRSQTECIAQKNKRGGKGKEKKQLTSPCVLSGFGCILICAVAVPVRALFLF